MLQQSAMLAGVQEMTAAEKKKAKKKAREKAKKAGDAEGAEAAAPAAKKGGKKVLPCSHVPVGYVAQCTECGTVACGGVTAWTATFAQL